MGDTFENMDIEIEQKGWKNGIFRISSRIISFWSFWGDE